MVTAVPLTTRVQRGDPTRSALILGVLWSLCLPAPASAQIFGKGARTEFLDGLGFRTFASVSEMTFQSTDTRDGASVLRRRVTPLSIVYGVRPRVSIVAVLPFVDTTLIAPGPAGFLDVGGDAGLGDALFLTKWRMYGRDRGRGTFRLAIEGGIKTPTGSTALRDDGGRRLPPPLQRGSGSWDPTVDLTATYAPGAGRARWIFSAAVGYAATTEFDGFEFGDRVAYDGMVKYRIHPARYPGRDTFLLVEMNGRWQDWATAEGSVLPDSGGHVLYLSPGVQVLLRQNVILEGGVQWPIRRVFRGAQFEPRFNVLIGARYIIVP